MDMLMDPDSAVRFEAVRALGSLSAEATVVIPALVAALKDPNDRVRSEAAQVLQEKVPHAYYPLLSLGLVLSEFVLSSSAETALIQYLLHPESAHLPHTLASVLNDPNPGMRSFAAQALATFRYNLADVIPAIAHALFDSESDVRFWSAVALEKSGKDAKEAIPALLHALHDSSESVPPVAARALGGIGDEAMIAVPALCEALQHEDPMTSFFSASALTCINPTLEAPIAVLVETLSNATDPQFRRLAVNALERLGPLAKLAVPTLLTALADQNQDVRQAVARALSVITER